jgi:hypothetical protein
LRTIIFATCRPHRYNLISDRSLPSTAHAKAIVDKALESV